MAARPEQKKLCECVMCATDPITRRWRFVSASSRMWRMKNVGSAWPCVALAILFAGCAHEKPSLIQSTPKLEILNKQIKLNPDDAQAYSNRGYTLALLGRKA